jgi:ABC-type branched-subunit amino acid transport system substrate-binding protein
MRPLTGLALGAVVVALLAACTAAPPGATSSPEASEAPTGDGVLRIGTLLPQTGSSAFIGPAQLAGVRLAIDEINAAGGIDGAPVELLSRDSGDASTTTVEASFAELAAAGTDVVIGPSSSVLVRRVIPMAATAGVTVVSPAATFPDLTAVGDRGYFFRTVPDYADQGYALGQVLSEGGPVEVGLLYIDDEFGQALAPTLAAGLEVRGSTLVVSHALPTGTTDFAAAVAELSEAAPDVVVLGSTYASVDTTKALISAAIGAGYTGGKLWLTTQNTGDYSQALPNGTLAGVNGIIEGYQPDEAITARLKALDSTLTNVRYAAEAYDATMLAALAAVVARDDSGSAIAGKLADVSSGGIKCTSFAECLEALKSGSDIDYDGLSGPVNFTPQGDISPAYYGIYSYDGENRFVFGRGVIAGRPPA